MGNDIGWAVQKLWDGYKVRRAGWNGPGQWVALQTPDAKSKMTLAYAYLSNVNGDLVPWLPSQGDLLAGDWELAE